MREAYLKYAGWDPWTGWDQDRFDFDMVTKIEPELKALGGGVFLMDYPPQAASLAKLSKIDNFSASSERPSGGLSPLASPVSGDAYLGYFKATATQVGEDQWRVAYDVDPEAIELAESVADIGPQLGTVASGDAKTITISSKPGLYYGIATAESPVGPYVCPRKTYAWGDSVTLPAPDPKPGLFMRIVVGAKE